MLYLESIFQAAKEEKFMAGQPLLTHSPRHIAGDVIYCGTEFIEVLPHSTQRHPKKPISHQVRQIYGGHCRRGSGSALQGGRRLLGRAKLRARLTRLLCGSIASNQLSCCSGGDFKEASEVGG